MTCFSFDLTCPGVALVHLIYYIVPGFLHRLRLFDILQSRPVYNKDTFYYVVSRHHSISCWLWLLEIIMLR